MLETIWIWVASFAKISWTLMRILSSDVNLENLNPRLVQEFPNSFYCANLSGLLWARFVLSEDRVAGVRGSCLQLEAILCYQVFLTSPAT